MSADVAHAMADQLRQYATHFAPHDWDYTRDLGDLVEIRHDNPRDRFWPRMGRVVQELTERRRETDVRKVMKVSRWRMAQVHLRRGRNLPDGVLDNGNIITHWEEHGEYLQYVQPSVGALLADLMDAHPDLPEVQAVAAEMKRINDRYGERIAAEEAGGEAGGDHA